MPAFAHLPTAAARARTPPKFRIVAETHDYLVVDKPPLLLIHPTKPDGTPTLWAALRQIGPGIILAGTIVGSGELLLTTSFGARYVDQPCVVDGNLVTARTWHDNTPFLREFIHLLNSHR